MSEYQYGKSTDQLKPINYPVCICIGKS